MYHIFHYTVIVCIFLFSNTPAGAQQGWPCESDSVFMRLDFWVGEWDVYDGQGQKVGENVIEKALHGCAILEHWVDANGIEGKSLFYYHPDTHTWKQVWITPVATRPGGLKEKHLIGEYDDGGVRFQGEITMPDGRKRLDRTTLTPLKDGRVRQFIELSDDGGATWRAGFEGFYVRKKR